jgi:ABC-2 type transport system permease protein
MLVIRREGGLLKRIRSTPLPGATYLLAVLLSLLVVFLLQSAAMFALGISMFGADGPSDIVSLLAVMLLGVAAFAGMGFAAAALIRSADGASAVINLILLPMAFISGSFVPTQEYPEWLQTLGDVLPLKHLIDLLRGVYLDGMPIWDAPGSVAVVAAWGLAGALVAARRFGWEPRER